MLHALGPLIFLGSFFRGHIRCLGHNTANRSSPFVAKQQLMGLEGPLEVTLPKRCSGRALQCPRAWTEGCSTRALQPLCSAPCDEQPAPTNRDPQRDTAASTALPLNWELLTAFNVLRNQPVPPGGSTASSFKDCRLHILQPLLRINFFTFLCLTPNYKTTSLSKPVKYISYSN